MPRVNAGPVILSHRTKVALDAARVAASLYIPFHHVALRWGGGCPRVPGFFCGSVSRP